MKKKILILLAVLTVVLLAVPTAFAAEVVDSGTCGDPVGEAVTWTLTDDGILTISGEGDMYDYYYDYYMGMWEGLPCPWSYYKNYVTEVIVEEGVTSVSSYGFWEFKNLKRVTLPEGITYIGSYTFDDCVALEEINLPQSLKRINSHTFSDCKKLISIEIPAEIDYIGEYAFYGSGIELIEIPEGITEISDNAFSNCASLKSVTLSNSITEIGRDAFWKCEKLEGIDLPEGLITIGNTAFAYCSALEEVTIPASVTQLGTYSTDNVFSNCSSLRKITVAEGNTSYVSTGGLLFNYDKTELCAVALGYEGELYIPSTVSNYFVGYAFYTYSKPLTSGFRVDPGNQNYFSDENGALYEKKVEPVFDGSDWEYIEKVRLVFCPITFQGDFTVPEAVSSIAGDTFAGCTKLTNVYFEKTEYEESFELGPDTFKDCIGLTEIVLPSGTSLGGTATFIDCVNLRSVEFLGKTDYLSSGTFSGCKNLEKIRFGTEIRYIGGVFAELPKVKSIIIPYAQSMERDVFANSSLETIYFTGNAPESFPLEAFGVANDKYDGDTRITVTAYYPENDETWTDIVNAEYEGFVTWVPYDPETELPCYHDTTALKNDALPSCTAPGYTGDTVCVACGEVLESGSEIPKLPHTEEIDKAVPATCTEIGLTEGTHCSVCKTVIVAQKETAMLDHTFVDGKCSCGAKDPDYVKPTEPEETKPTEPEETKPTEPEETKPTEPEETKPTEPEDTKPSEPEETKPSEPEETKPTEPEETKPTEPEETKPTEPEDTKPSEPEETKPTEPEETKPNEPEETKPTEPEETKPTEPEGTKPSEPEETKPTEPEGTKPSEPEETKPTEPEESEPTEPPCEHKWSQWEVTNPTSEKEGQRARKCESCGEVENEVLPKLSGAFKDVKDTEYYALPVDWAVQKKITTGVGESKFAPNDNCTRGQIVTFLWRAAGEPEPTSTKNPFKDVKSGDYFYKAVLWAVEEGITNGLSATSFGPNASCTRAQVCTFLWRSQGEPDATGSNPFEDVKKGEYYFDAVLWAVENGVTNGMGEGKFAPNNTCTRGQIVTFLYRTIA